MERTIEVSYRDVSRKEKPVVLSVTIRGPEPTGAHVRIEVTGVDDQAAAKAIYGAVQDGLGLVDRPLPVDGLHVTVSVSADGYEALDEVGDRNVLQLQALVRGALVAGWGPP